MLEYLHRTFAANPLFGRQLATSFSGPRLGLAFLLVNLVLFLTYMILFIYFMEEGTLFTKDESVPLAYFWHNTILYFLLAILLPIKISGFIEGPRINRAFDQIVVTGVSPLKFFFGAWFSGMAYTAILLLVTIPYLGCLYLISGEMGLDRFAGGYAILFVYSNVIILVTLAMSVLGREWFMVPLCIFGFIITGIFGLIIDPDWVWGYPTHIAEITPARLFWRQTEPFYLWGRNIDATRALIHGDPVLFSSAIPLNLYTALLWVGLGCVSIAIIVLGPAHRFSPGLNNFGTAILPGDRKKRFFRRLRGGLTRRVELAFFYENRARGVDRWGYLTRIFLGFLPVILVWGVILGRAYGGYPVPYGRNGFFDDETVHVVTILSGIVLFFWILYHCDARHQVYQKVSIGRFIVPRELILYASFAILLSGLFYIHYSTLGAMQTNYAISQDYFAKVRDIATLQQQAGSMVETVSAVLPINFRPTDILKDDVYARYMEDWWVYIPGFLFFLANLFLMTRVVTRFTQSVLVARFLAVAFTLAIVFVPIMILVLVFEEMLPVSFMKLGGLTPLILAEDLFNQMWADQRVALYYTSHVVFGGLLVMLLGSLHLLAWRNGRRLAAKLSPKRPSVAIAALIVFFSLSSARAQDAPGPQVVDSESGGTDDSPAALDLVIEKVTRGFAGSVFAENIDFYTAVVRNESDETITGRYWVRDDDRYNRGGQGEKREFELGPKTTKVFRWGSRSSFDPYRGYRGQSTTTHVVFEAQGQILMSQSLTLNRRGQRQRGNSNPQQREGAFLFVAPRAVTVVGGWAKAAMSGNTRNALTCGVEDLPERAGFYLGLDAVVVGPLDQEWTRRQRDALYDYVRLGGSVVLYGDVNRSGLPVAGLWEDLFRASESRDLRLETQLIFLEQQDEGRDVFHVPNPAGGAPVPLLNVRSVGGGHVSHVGFSLDRTPDTVAQGKSFWADFDRAMPRSRFPLVPADPLWRSDRTLDLSSLFLILGYFLGYTLLFSGSLVFFFRKRRHRAILWSLVVGVPLLFVAFVPALNAFMHSRPSLAETRDLAFFGPGSSRGITVSQVTVRSSGRQEHELELSGRELATIPFTRWGSYRYYYNNALPDLDYGASDFELIRRPGSSRDFDLSIDTVPWTSRSFEVFGTYKLDRPVKSRADLYRAAGKLSFEVELPFDLPVERAFLLLHGFHSEKHFQQIGVELESTQGSVLKGDLSLEKTFLAATPNLRTTSPHSYYNAMQTISIPGGINIAWNLRARRRVFLAVAPKPEVDMGMEMRSDDIAFETPSSVHSYRELRDERRWYGGRIEKRGEEYIRNLRYRLFVFELPLEEK